MEEEYVYNVVNDEEIKDDDVVLVINDWYAGSDNCNYAMPVADSPDLPYTIVKESKIDDKEVYHNVSYNL